MNDEDDRPMTNEEAVAEIVRVFGGGSQDDDDPDDEDDDDG